MSNAFTLFPMNQEIDLEPGQVYQGSITIANPAAATEDFHYVVSVSPYQVMGQDYTADFTTVSDWSRIVNWITIDEPTGAVAPNERKEITFSIAVPADAPAGGQYAVLGVRSSDDLNKDDGLTVQNVVEMASIIYARVAGETRHEGEILANNIPGFVTNGQPMVSALITNNGNVHETAVITLTVKNAMTGEMVFPLGSDVNTYNEVLMPESTRLVTRNIDQMPILGVFEVTQDIAYLGSDSDYTHNTTVMVACPLWFLLLAILAIGALVGGIAGGIYKHSKNRRVF